MQPHILLFGQPRQFPNYERALVQAGAVVRYGDGGGCDGLVLPGGGDVHPMFYGAAAAHCSGMDVARDLAELALCRSFLGQGLPVLGICRGLQVLNVALGGTLAQHVEGHSQVNGLDRLHPTRTAAGSWVRELYGHRFTVNSAHHQAIDRLGPGLEAVQWAEDGIIEGIAHPSLPAYGVQWHPERLQEGGKKWDTVDGNRLFSWFLSRCGG